VVDDLVAQLEADRGERVQVGGVVAEPLSCFRQGLRALERPLRADQDLPSLGVLIEVALQTLRDAGRWRPSLHVVREVTHGWRGSPATTMPTCRMPMVRRPTGDDVKMHARHS